MKAPDDGVELSDYRTCRMYKGGYAMEQILKLNKIERETAQGARHLQSLQHRHQGM